ncbi:hypothetical protein ASPWEDRAFT_46558 [Aspergillus wentii DTO 134E9]|uniref:Leucine-rich repeat domain-containing protein n=1 Tax=Aspergillus wentii DTO 134E9 TaxID=1073089 RepID=A0A1L9R4H2_ASPWE|nr:uncharacterized protein ASPWEDRAFT_46558 [Aspergillus wentii DTO 134E9]OJJ29794.1 hypothetical protein ASPWEDRAFT_46558 [Aspergillus wentii DTO 134E9]
MPHLPDEILLQIAGHVEHQKDHLCFIIACRRFYDVLLPTLYTDVKLLNRQRPWAVNDTAQVRSFLRAVFRNPALAQNVRSLRLVHPWADLISELGSDNDYFDDFDKAIVDGNTSEYSVEDMDDAMNQVLSTSYIAEDLEEQELGEDQAMVDELMGGAGIESDLERRAWELCLEYGFADVWVAMLLPRLNNIRKLSLRLPDGGVCVVQTLKRAARQPSSVFPYLSDVFVEDCSALGCTEAYRWNSFFAFPSMRRMHGVQVAELESPQAPTASSSATEIDLYQCGGGQGMKDWVGRCKALKSFRMISGNLDLTEVRFDPNAYCRSLTPHKETLEFLWLDCGSAGGEGDSVELTESFATFTALRHLHLRLENMFKRMSNLFPPSLEALFLREGNQGETGGIHHLTDMIRSRSMPRLSRVDLEMGMDNNHEVMAVLQDLQVACSNAGVSCVLWERNSNEAQDYANSTWNSLHGRDCTLTNSTDDLRN